MIDIAEVTIGPSAAVFLVIGLLPACASVDHKTQFESQLNGLVGQVVDETPLRYPHWINHITTSRVEHAFKNSKGCSYAVEFDKETRLIRRWRYLSEPDLCWKPSLKLGA